MLPLLGVVLGILAGHWLQIPLSCLVGSLLLALLGLFFFKSLKYLVVLLTLAIFSALNYTWQIIHVTSHDLRNIVQEEAAIVTVVGRVDSIPFEKNLNSNIGTNSVITRFILNIELLQFRRSTTNISATGRVIAVVRGKLDESIGDGSKVKIFGVIKRPPSSKIYGLYNYREDLKNRKIFYVLDVYDASDVVRIDSDQTISLREKFIKWTDKTLRYGLPDRLKETDLRMAMLFGLKTKVSDEIQKSFMRAGTMHLFAVSGIHVGILSGAILILLMSFNLPRHICGWITLPLLWFFTAATGWQVSATRAAVMVTILIGSWILNRPSNFLNSLFAAAIIILLCEPHQLFQIGFQLSFAVVLMLGLSIPIFKKSFQELLKTDPFLPAQLLPAHKRTLINSAHYAGSALITSMAAFIGSLPLIAKYFNIVSPISIFANLIVVPLGALCLVSSVASMISALFYLPLAEIFNWSGWVWAKCMIEVTTYFSNLSFGWFYIKPPSTPQVILFYLLFAQLFLLFSAERIRKILLICFPICLAAFAVTFLNEQNEMEVNIISFERGHTVYVQNSFLENTLVDCGTSEDVHSLIEPFLISRGVNKISKLFLTHGDITHVGGAIELSKLFFIENVYVSNFKQRSRSYMQAIEHFNALKSLNIVVHPQRIGIWEILSPNSEMQSRKADDRALILKGIVGNTKVLLLSDISKEAFNRLVETDADLKAEIVVGSVFSINHVLLPDCLSRISPKTLIIVEHSSAINTGDLRKKIRSLATNSISVYWVNSYSGITLKMKKSGYFVQYGENAHIFLPTMNEF